MKKFTDHPIGLGIICSEYEKTATYLWNRYAEGNISLDQYIEVSQVIEKNFNYKHKSEGLFSFITYPSLIESGYILEKEGKYKLAPKTIEIYKKYLNKK